MEVFNRFCMLFRIRCFCFSDSLASCCANLSPANHRPATCTRHQKSLGSPPISHVLLHVPSSAGHPRLSHLSLDFARHTRMHSADFWTMHFILEIHDFWCLDLHTRFRRPFPWRFRRQLKYLKTRQVTEYFGGLTIVGAGVGGPVVGATEDSST